LQANVLCVYRCPKMMIYLLNDDRYRILLHNFNKMILLFECEKYLLYNDYTYFLNDLRKLLEITNFILNKCNIAWKYECINLSEFCNFETTYMNECGNHMLFFLFFIKKCYFCRQNYCLKVKISIVLTRFPERHKLF
jgi:hypothetical protein